MDECTLQTKPVPEIIIWLFNRWQPLYDDISRTWFLWWNSSEASRPTWTVIHYFDPRKRNMVVLDDLT